MARRENNIHYIYKIICNITGRWYIGMHSTTNLNDGYMGSGTILRHSIRKHGKENHIKEILEYLPNRELLAIREREIVNKELISDGKCMNLKEGGDGGFMSEEHMMKCSKAGNIAFKEKLINDKEFKENFCLTKSENSKKAMLEGKLIPINKSYDWTGKKQSDETKKLMSESSKGTGTNENNSQYGTCWITKDGINKKIRKEDLDNYLEKSWVKGRFTELKGELIKNSILTNDDVVKIKELLNEDNLIQIKISEIFNVHPETISKIKRGIIWKSVT